MSRNPPWMRDELILALDLYFQVNPLHSSESHPEIEALSRLLNALPLHAERPDEVVFRNPNGVYMKLCNYLRLDPTYHGRGLSRGGKQEEEIWKEFAGDRHRLHEIANAIRQGYRSIKSKDLSTEVPSPDEEFLEGRILTALHKRRERNPTVVRRKKATVLHQTGRLACEACDFDFEVRYGQLGTGFAECQHRAPLSQLGGATRMTLDELAIICANCHRMIHRSRPMLSVDELRRLLVARTVAI
jgi:5-methylcytosine-specific restriction protein A